MQHERHPFPGGEWIEHHLQGDAHGIGQHDVVGRVGEVSATSMSASNKGCGRAARSRHNREVVVDQPGRLDLGVAAVQSEPRRCHDILGLDQDVNILAASRNSRDHSPSKVAVSSIMLTLLGAP